MRPPLILAMGMVFLASAPAAAQETALTAAGFALEEIHGDWNGADWTPAAAATIVRARRRT